MTEEAKKNPIQRDWISYITNMIIIIIMAPILLAMFTYWGTSELRLSAEASKISEIQIEQANLRKDIETQIQFDKDKSDKMGDTLTKMDKNLDSLLKGMRR